jgi:hypothetical protein
VFTYPRQFYFLGGGGKQTHRAEMTIRLSTLWRTKMNFFRTKQKTKSTRNQKKNKEERKKYDISKNRRGFVIS